MDKFVKYIKSLEESKQVGIIYHFTTLSAIQKLTDKNFMAKYGCDILTFISYNNYISTTRDFMLTNNPLLDFNNSTHPVRITLDGNKISRKYKVKPINGLQNPDSKIFGTDLNHLRVKHKSEKEEVICPLKDNIFPLKEYIIQIDFLNSSNEDEIEIFRKVKEELSNTNILVQSVRKWSISKLNEDLNKGHFSISHKDVQIKDEFIFEEVENTVKYLPFSIYKRAQKITNIGEFELLRFNSTKWYVGQLIENEYNRSKFCCSIYIETDSYKNIIHIEEHNNELLNESLDIIKNSLKRK